MNERTGKSPLPGTLQERLRQGQFVMTAELVPPLSCDAQALLNKAVALRASPTPSMSPMAPERAPI